MHVNKRMIIIFNSLTKLVAVMKIKYMYMFLSKISLFSLRVHNKYNDLNFKKPNHFIDE